MASELDQKVPNRVPRKLGAQLCIALTLLTMCVVTVPIALIFRPFDYNILWFGIIGSLVGPVRIFVAQQGYQIGYDGDCLYQRNWGWSWRTLRRFPVHCMAYDEIALMRGRFLDRGGFKKSFFPYDYIELRSKHHDVPDIEIYPIYLRHPEDKDLLAAIYAHRPELFPHDVVAYMNGNRAL